VAKKAYTKIAQYDKRMESCSLKNYYLNMVYPPNPIRSALRFKIGGAVDKCNSVG